MKPRIKKKGSHWICDDGRYKCAAHTIKDLSHLWDNRTNIEQDGYDRLNQMIHDIDMHTVGIDQTKKDWWTNDKNIADTGLEVKS